MNDTSDRIIAEDAPPPVTADQIRARYPQLGEDIVQFCVAEWLDFDAISGALYMAQRKRRNHRQAMAASNHWTPPSTRQRKSAKRR